MDRDDEQQHRHISRYTAEGLAIFYREMRRARLPRLASAALTVEHYRMLMRPSPPTVSEIKEIMDDLRRDEDE